MKLGKLFLLLLFILTLLNINAQENKKYEMPILVTSAGQSADVKLAGLLLKRQKLAAETITMAKATDLENVKTLIIVPGFSSKGLGAAGISAEEELNRVKELLKSAKEMKIPVVLLHIGGKARRQGQSDTFIKEVADIASHMIVVKMGNEDGFFTDLSKKQNIQLELIEKIQEASAPLEKLFK